MPLGLRIGLEKRLQLVRQRGRGNRRRQDADARPLQTFLDTERGPHGLDQRSPRANVAQVGQGLRTVRVVHAQDRGLRKNIGAAETGRMLVVTFNLGGTIQMALDQNRAGISAQSERRGKKQRPPGHHFFGLLHVGDNRFERLLGAGGHSRHGQGCAHQLEESAARNRIQPLRRALGKFAVQHLLEVGTARQFLEAAPVFRTLGLGQFGTSRIQIERALLAGTDVLAVRLAGLLFHFHALLLSIQPYRWHVEQLVMSVTVRNLYFFTRSVPREIWSVYSLPSNSTGLPLVGCS